MIGPDGVVGLLQTVLPSSFFLLFVAGHLLGDFCLQPRWMVTGKRRIPILLAHGAVVATVHLVVLAPFLSVPVATAVLAVAMVHVVIDFLKLRWASGRFGQLGLFLLDQAAHVATVTGAACLLFVAALPPSRMAAEEVDLWTGAMLTLGVLAFNWTGGSEIVRGTLAGVSAGLEEEAAREGDDSDQAMGSGRLIGILERSIALILIVLGEWGALALLVGVKSIARFEALKDRPFAEYYLIGTLTSLLVAILSGLLLTWAVFGFG